MICWGGGKWREEERCRRVCLPMPPAVTACTPALHGTVPWLQNLPSPFLICSGPSPRPVLQRRFVTGPGGHGGDTAPLGHRAFVFHPNPLKTYCCSILLGQSLANWSLHTVLHWELLWYTTCCKKFFRWQQQEPCLAIATSCTVWIQHQGKACWWISQDCVHD